MLDALVLAKCLVSAFFAILFLQSGTDKLLDWKGNLEYLTGHFSKSPFHSIVPLLMGTIMVVEIATGALCGGSTVVSLLGGGGIVPVLALAMSCVALLMLFTGQRIAKDYAGAQTLACYFAVALIGLTIMWPGWQSPRKPYTRNLGTAQRDTR